LSVHSDVVKIKTRDAGSYNFHASRPCQVKIHLHPGKLVTDQASDWLP